jgi:hypothetical protein
MTHRAEEESDLGQVEGALSGCVAAVLGSSLIGSAVLGVAYALDGETSVQFSDLIIAPFIFLLALVGSIPVVGLVAIIVGLPFSALVAHLKMESALTYGLGGLLLGLLMTLPNPSFEGLLRLSGGVYGSCCGLLWWRAYRRWCQ